MTDLPRLNGIIAALEQGLPAFGSFMDPDPAAAIAFANTDYDGLVIEMEHNPFDVASFKQALYFLQDRRRIAMSGSVAPRPTPIVRIPPNGGEMNQFCAKQVLDTGAYGVVWPHVSTADEAYNAVAACRYPRPEGSPRYEPEGIRGDGPARAARYWGLTQKEYYARADVWGIDPQGEILVVAMIEDVKGLGNLDDILTRVPGIGVVLIGEGDLSQNLGHPREYDHPVVRAAMAEIVAICRKHGVAAGQPHVGPGNVERVLAEGYRFLLAKPTVTYPALHRGLELSGRR